MAKQQRFHLFKRDEQHIESHYVHRVLVLSVDGHEIELIAQETDDLIDLLIAGRKDIGWERIEIPIPHKELVESVLSSKEITKSDLVKHTGLHPHNDD